MILSAGYGTRLKPYTDNLPKALVKYRNIPMINYQINRLKEAGADEIIINAHHFPELMTDHFLQNDFGVKCTVITEKDILGTGGGILNAEYLLRNEKYFLVINVDVDTDMDLQGMRDYHELKDPFATIAVQKRPTLRRLEFDDNMKLIGRSTENINKKNLYGFNGIHIISGRIFEKGIDTKFEDILNIYLEVIADKKEFVAGYDAGNSTFKDLGRPENLFF